MPYMLYDLTPADPQPEDDIDQLFNRLPRIEPPDGLIKDILLSVGRLPVLNNRPPLTHQVHMDRWTDTGLGTLVIRNEKRGPS
jgi:hypothetical protein